MIIERIEIISFGKFKNKIIDFSDGLNVIYGDNESGKSTVISFIYSMLYGFGDNRGKTLSLREKYTPWDGGVCEGKLIVKADDGRSITIYRKAGNVKKYDTLQVFDSKTGEELSLLPEDIAQVGSDTFLKTLCVRQLSAAIDGSNDEIAQKLANIAAGGDENISFEKAQKLLEAVRREIQPQRGSGGALSLINRQITDAEKSMASSREASAELDSLLSVLSEEKQTEAMLKAEYEALLKKDYSAPIAHLSGRIEEKQKHSRNISPMLNILLIFSAFILSLFIKSAALLLFLWLFVFTLIFIIMKKRPFANNDTAHLIEEKEKLLEEKEIHEKKLSDLKNRLESSHDRLTQLKIREQTLISTADLCKDNTEELYKKRQLLERKLRTVTLALSALESAHQKMQKNFTPALNKKASEYFCVISGGKYSRVFCNEHFGIKIDNDIPRESSFFSGGTVDQLYLALRLALVDMLFKEKTCTIILDQPFLQYDDLRKKNTVELLESLQKNRQILLFTGDKNVNSSNKTTEILT